MQEEKRIEKGANQKPLFLNKKLQNLCSWIEEDLEERNFFYDVGCDHGKLLLFLYEKYKEKNLHFIGTDIKEASLLKAKNLFLERKTTEPCAAKLSFHVGNGLRHLAPLPLKSAVVIAGMGGEEIVDILRQINLPSDLRLYLHPTKSQAFLRYFLQKKGFIFEENLCLEKEMLYTLIKAFPQKNNLDSKNKDFFSPKRKIFQIKEAFLKEMPFLSENERKLLWLGKDLKNFPEAYKLYLQKLSRFFEDKQQAPQGQDWEKDMLMLIQKEKNSF